MTKPGSPAQIGVQALLLADHIYQDHGSGKYVLAGTFHQLNVPGFPTTFGRTIGVFASLTGVSGKTAIGLEFVDASTGDILMRSPSLEISGPDADAPVDFALEVPQLPLPHPGRYLFRLLVDGAALGTVAVSVRGPGNEG